ncbi:MAG: hypothetical protein EKK56_04900 [Flavobacteriaceae bacterium]|nr:MAG: hypothetical protein EKK56_04900 [Flavobacteriaceae bacterium]
MFENLNNSKKIKVITYVCLAFISLFIVASFGQYYQMKLNFQNPLIPEYLVKMATNPYLEKGIIMILGVIGVFGLLNFKKNFYALLIAIGIVLFYVFSKHYIGGWHTQI